MQRWLTYFRNSAERGEWAEIRFVARAVEQRLRVSKPWGNSAPYDLMVESDGLAYRVQVKSTIHRVGPGSYGCRLPSDKRMLVLLKEVDFIAAYVIPADIWYIIPVATVRQQKGSISLSPWKRGAKFDRYLESWFLLRQWRKEKKSRRVLKQPEASAPNLRVGPNSPASRPAQSGRAPAKLKRHPPTTLPAESS